jgi:hypothetical protein
VIESRSTELGFERSGALCLLGEWRSLDVACGEECF